jgi:dihydrofolate reductase
MHNSAFSRRLIVSMNVTLDGFMAGPDGSLDWHFQNWAPDMAEVLCTQLSNADTLLLGRNTYSAMAAYWPAAGLLLAREDIAFANMMNRYTKIVCSNTLTDLSWNNSQLIKRNIGRKVRELKQQAGKDIVIYGSGKLVNCLAKLGLIDQYQLWVYPVAIGRGIYLFNNGIKMRLLKTRQFSSGVVLFYYEPYV